MLQPWPRPPQEFTRKLWRELVGGETAEEGLKSVWSWYEQRRLPPTLEPKCMSSGPAMRCLSAKPIKATRARPGRPGGGDQLPNTGVH